VSHVHVSRVNRGWVLRSHDHVSPDEFDAAISTIRSSGGGAVRWFVSHPTDVEKSCAKRHHLTPDVPLLLMRCDLPLDARHRVPDGFFTRPFRPGLDNDEWLEVNARAFAGHPEQGDWNHVVLAERLAAPWFDPHGFLIHEVEGRIAGFCWTQVHDDAGVHHHHDADGHHHDHTGVQHHDHAHDEHRPSEPAGEIYVIGVDPAHHGKGLGRALTIAGFAHLSGKGLRQGMLYVAGDNAPAIGLYTSLGMRVAHQDDVFSGVVA